MSCSSSYTAGTESTYYCDTENSDYKYGFGPFDEVPFLELDNIVECLYKTKLLNDIECRKIMSRKRAGVVQTRAAIYDILITKDPITFKKILQVFRNRAHPFQNPKILLRIFSHLNFADISKCQFVSHDWKQIGLMMLGSKYDEVNMEEILMMNLRSKNENIKKTIIRFPKGEIKRSSAFQLMLATNPEKDDTLLEMLQIERDIPNVNNSSIKGSCAAENNIDDPIAKVLNNHYILSNVFNFLSLENIKNCRTVCRTWSSASEVLLRKKSRIHFNTKLTPIDFVNVAKYLPIPEFPFKNFKFQKTYSSDGVSEFFTYYGKNIQSLVMFLANNVRSCLLYTQHLTELNLEGKKLKSWTYRDNPLPKEDPKIMIPWSSLQSIKILSLSHSVIEIDNSKKWKRIIPVKLDLNMVNFFVGGCYPDEITFHDYIDFTKVTHVNIIGTVNQKQQFDCARDIFHALQISLSNTRFVNAGMSNSTVDHLKLNCRYPFSEKNYMSIKQLIIDEGYISLEALPPSLEKLGILPNTHIKDMESMNLPNLQYLSYQADKVYRALNNFMDCPNLKDMEIIVIDSKDITLLPRNIKRLKIETSTGELKFVGGLPNEHVNLDLLVLDSIASSTLNDLQFDKLRPKVLAVNIKGGYSQYDIISFIKRNKNMDKIYVRLPCSINPNTFSTMKISTIVDKASQIYEFSNERGKAITSEEYLTIPISLDIKTVMEGVWNTDEEDQYEENPRWLDNGTFELFESD